MGVARTMKNLIYLAMFAPTTLLLAYYPLKELNYATRGVNTEGTVVQSSIREEPGGRAEPRQILTVEFTYQDQAGRQHTGIDRSSGSVQPPSEGDTVGVQYVPGDELSARLTAHGTDWLILACFFLCAAATVSCGWSVWRAATEERRQTKRRTTAA